MPIGDSVIVPKRIGMRFPSRACSGGGGGESYQVEYAGASDYVAGAPSACFGTKMFMNTALAEFDPDGSGPTNSGDLRDLIEKFAEDYYAWKSVYFDMNFSGIIVPEQTAIYDEMVFDYFSDKCDTRLKSSPYNSEPEELGHHVTGNADDCEADAKPCVFIYGRGASCVGNKLQIPVYRLCLEDGRLRLAYVRTDEIG